MTLINQVITKLESIRNKDNIIDLNYTILNKKLIELKNLNIVNQNIRENSYLVLSYFLQSINLDIFLVEELEFLLLLDYTNINLDITNTLSKQQLKKNTSPKLTRLFDLKGKLINIEYKDRYNIRDNFIKLHNINNNYSITYLISYIINQV